MSIKNILRICVVNINRYITIRHCSQSFDLYLFIRDSVLLYSSAKKASRDIYIYYFHFYITATLFAYFLVCHLYIFMNQMFLFSCTIYKCKILLICELVCYTSILLTITISDPHGSSGRLCGCNQCLVNQVHSTHYVWLTGNAIAST